PPPALGGRLHFQGRTALATDSAGRHAGDMVTEMMSRWPVHAWLPLSGDERDVDGFLTEAGIAGLFEQVRAVYLRDCATLVDVPLAVDGAVLERGSVPVPGEQVSVSVAVVEVFPDHVTMTMRFRPQEGPGV